MAKQRGVKASPRTGRACEAPIGEPAYPADKPWGNRGGWAAVKPGIFGMPDPLVGQSSLSDPCPTTTDW